MAAVWLVVFQVSLFFSGALGARVERVFGQSSLLKQGRLAYPRVVVSCEQAGGAQIVDDQWEKKFRKALEPFCARPDFADMFRVTLDPDFEEQYWRYYDAQGWVEAAWVNYVGVKESVDGDPFGQLTKRLAESIRVSQYPLVIVNFGEKHMADIHASEFPNVVLFHAAGLPQGLSFNFNKLRAILVAKVKIGVSLDSDMIMIGKQADQLMRRTRDEITDKYPFPMLPTHFLDRDPRDRDLIWRKGQTNWSPYSCKGCPEETMRWGQAQPSWTYWSLPFLSKWLNARMVPQQTEGVAVGQIAEDEDLLNVALWAENASKAWCAFQPGGIEFIEQHFVKEQPLGRFYDDPHYFPGGVPVAFFFIHGQKNLTIIDEALQFLKDIGKQVDTAKAFHYKGAIFSSFAEIHAVDPTLKCVL